MEKWLLVFFLSPQNSNSQHAVIYKEGCKWRHTRISNEWHALLEKAPLFENHYIGSHRNYFIDLVINSCVLFIVAL